MLSKENVRHISLQRFPFVNGAHDYRENELEIRVFTLSVR